MSKRLTKKQMVKEIFFEATIGQRSANNFVQGMGIIDSIAENNYRWLIQYDWNAFVAERRKGHIFGELEARVAIRHLINSTKHNLLGRNLDPTSRSVAFEADLRKFKF